MKQMNLTNDVVIPSLFALYVYAVFKVILFKFDAINITFLWHQLQMNLGNPVNIKNGLLLANFTPFESISNNILRHSSHDLINLFGNIAIFMPYGMFLLFMSKNPRMSFIGVFAMSLGFSLSLECLQLIFSIGSFDVDDLILNVSGGLLGYGVFKVYTKFVVIMPSVIQDSDRVSILSRHSK